MKRFRYTVFILFVVCAISSGCIDLQQIFQMESPLTGENTPGLAIAKTADSYVGVPYVWGGTSPKGFDCSGLTYYAFKKHGINIPRTSLQQSTYGTAVNKSDLRPGDLVFFTVKSRSKVDHVGMYLGGDMLVHAPNPNTPVLRDRLSTYSDKYKGVYHSARRIAPDTFSAKKK